MKEKLRNRERYRRPISEATSFPAHTSEEHYWVIPDGVTWRKYFPLLRLLVEEGVCNLVLLESAVDLLDYRSVSPCLQTTTDNDNNNKFVPEKPAPQERSKISKLIQQYPGRVFPFCDLSLQEDEHDEFDEMQYSSLGISERSQHALLRAGRMLREQCPGVNESTNILVICTDEEFASKFPSEDGLDLLLVDKFLEDVVSNNNSFFTLKKRCEEDYALRNIRKSVKQNDGELKEYYTENHIQEGMKNKTLAKGRLEVTKDNPKEGFVTTSDGLTYFLNQQLGHYNRAFHHDIVCIKILGKAEWGRPVGRRRLVHHSDGDEDNQGQAIDVDFSPPVPSARVVAIVEPSRRQFITTVVNLPMNDETSVLVIPMDYRIPKIRIKTNAWKRYVGNRLLVQVDAWGVDSKYPAGHCNKIIGPIGDLETEIACLLHEHELRLEPFSAAALASLPPEGSDWEIPPEEIKRRKDLRSSHRIFSVDPPGCQDIDDTMHAKVLPNGDIEIGVHIADVTYFVKHNSPLDLEAQIRGTTFYLVDRRFDMLPSLLSSGTLLLFKSKSNHA
jgi:DIS3-like exonuclease 1